MAVQERPVPNWDR